jgi:hypothetical protein
MPEIDSSSASFDESEYEPEPIQKSRSIIFNENPIKFENYDPQYASYARPQKVNSKPPRPEVSEEEVEQFSTPDSFNPQKSTGVKLSEDN